MNEFLDSVWQATQDFFAFLFQIDYLGFISVIFENMTLEIGMKILVVYLLLLWLGIAVRVTKDILNRTNSILLQMLCILLILVGTPLGIFFYLLIRPSRTLYERYYEELALDGDEEEKPRWMPKNTPKEQTFHIVIELKSDMLVDGKNQKWKLSGVYDNDSGENLKNITISPASEEKEEKKEWTGRKEIRTNFSDTVPEKKETKDDLEAKKDPKVTEENPKNRFIAKAPSTSKKDEKA